MNTEEAMVQLNDALLEEGISNEERLHRVTIFQAVCVDAQQMSDQINAKKAEMRKKRKPIPLSKALEACFISLAIGWFAGVFSLAYYQNSQ